MKRSAFRLLPLLGLPLACIATPPAAPVRDVTDVYFGTTVHDPYRYLENAADPEVAAWLKAQGEAARKAVDALPGREALLQDVVRYGQSAPSRIWDFQVNGDSIYYLRRAGNEDLPKLYVRRGWKAPERLLVDPTKYRKEGAPQAAITYFRPSPDNRWLAFGIAEGGSENAVLRVAEVATAMDSGLAITRVQFGPPSWLPNNRLLYNRLRELPVGTASAEKYLDTEMYMHRLGEPVDRDRLLLSRTSNPTLGMLRQEVPTIYYVPGVPWLFAQVQDGTRREFKLYIARPEEIDAPQIAWRQVVTLDDQVIDASARGDMLYARTHRNAPNFELRGFDMRSGTFGSAKIVLAQSDRVLEEFAAAKDALYVRLMKGGLSEILRISVADNKSAKINLPFAGDASGLATDVRVPGAAFRLGSWTRFAGIYATMPPSLKIVDTGLQPYGRFDRPADLVATEVEVVSQDGVKVPMSIVHLRNLKLDGGNATLLEGYGGYGISMLPNYGPTELAFLERGGVLATIHVRGGGENGQAWYDGGRGATKPNTWKDAVAGAEYLIAKHYTVPARLTIWGTSAGGILAGGALTDRPDLFGGVVMSVPVSDTVRFEFSQNALNTPEFGTVKEEASFRNLLAMSPYARVKDGTPYPAVLLTGGMNDPRVDVWQPAKMAARLQAATTSGKPILLLVKGDEGHGIGSTMRQRWADLADVYAFALNAGVE